MSLFLTILTVLKCTGQVVHRRSLDWDLPSIFPQWDWSYRLLGERPQRESVILIISHHVEESCYASNVIYQCCCWPRSSGRGRLLGFSALRVTLLAPFLLSFCKEVTKHSLHGRSGGLCTTSLRVEYLQKLLTILLHASITFLRFYFLLKYRWFIMLC